MTTDEIGRRLAALFRKRTEPLRAPTASEWQALRASLGWTWPDDFFGFHSVVGDYWFEGELLGVASIDDSDTIAVAREAEVRIGGWPEDLVPFLAVGNGDYYCLARREGGSSGVYYVFHEDRRVEQLHDSFENWIERLDVYYTK
jgi:hypothetical protein